MVIKNISNLEDSLNYYNDILDCNEEVISLDFIDIIEQYE